jgi:guanosine-3',5'-bis(diphosphate) 3'-pyrophosphohydrolase
MNKSSNEILEYVKEFTDRSHDKQVRKYSGERYIVHPVRVMETVREFNDDAAVLAAALLHDVLEDTPVKAHEIESALLQVMGADKAQRAIAIVIELTDIFIKKDFPRLNRTSRKEKEVQRLSSVSPEAQTIKYADIIDNVTDIVKQDADFARVFVREAKAMLTAMKDGNPELRKRAFALVDKCLLTLPEPARTV